MPSLPTPTITPLPKWYRSIVQLPLNKFIDVAVDGNYAALIQSGFPSEAELLQAWEEIKTEYSDAIGDNENKLYISLFKEINILTLTLQQVHLLVECLDQVYYEPFAAKLNGILYTSFKFDPDQPEEYRKLLKGCINRSKAFKIDLDLKTIQFQAIEKKNEGKGTYTREYFQSILITLSDHAKYPIMETVTVSEFCIRMSRYSSYCDQMDKRK